MFLKRERSKTDEFGRNLVVEEEYFFIITPRNNSSMLQYSFFYKTRIVGRYAPFLQALLSHCNLNTCIFINLQEAYDCAESKTKGSRKKEKIFPNSSGGKGLAIKKKLLFWDLF